MDTLTGSVERITFYNPENGYTVLRLRPENQKGIHAVPKSSLSFDGLATVVGKFYSYRDNGQDIQHMVPSSKPKFANKPCRQRSPVFKAIWDRE